MELTDIKEKYQLNYENEVTTKIVSKILYKLDTCQKDPSTEQNLRCYNK